MFADPSYDSSVARAVAAGLRVVDDPSKVDVDPDSVRLLDEDAGALAVTATGGRLWVVLADVPSPGELAALEQAAGMPISPVVASASAYRVLAEKVAEVRVSALAPVEKMMDAAIAMDAADLHLGVGAPPMVRVAGSLVAVAGWPPLSAGDMEAVVAWVAPSVDPATFDGDHDGAISYGGYRWRVNVCRQRSSLAATMRRLAGSPPALETLGVPPAIYQAADWTSGLVLVSGVTGSGKSTTLAGILDTINSNHPRKIITLEDPVEYVFTNRRSVVHQREVGADTVSFAAGLRAALRQDPDVVLVGEMRDPETIATALTAAETGHLVFSTVHASDAPGVISRIIDTFPAGEQAQVRTMLAASLRLVVCQVLVARDDLPGRRIPVCETMFANTAVRAMIREDRLHELRANLSTSAGPGSAPFDQNLAAAVRDGAVSRTEAERWVRDPAQFERHLGGH